MNRYARTLGAAVLVAAFNLSGAACSSSTTTTPTTTEPAPKAEAQAVETNLQMTWGTESALTRLYLIEMLGGLNDASVARNRLLQSQTQVGELMAAFYGSSVTAHIENLLRDRTQLLIDYATAVKATDDPTMRSIETKLDDNATMLGRTLAYGITAPVDLEGVLAGMFRAQGLLLRQEITARTNRDFAAAGTAHTGYAAHVTMVSETLFSVITNMRPDLVAASTLTPSERAVTTDVHGLWLDGQGRTREWLVTAVAGLSDSVEAMNELLRAERAIGDRIGKAFGPAVGAQATTLLAQHAVLLDAYVIAAKGGNATATASARAAVLANADAFGALAGTLGMTDATGVWRSDVEHTMNQVDARVAKNWSLDIASFDLALNDGGRMADVVSAGILAKGTY